MGMVLLPLPSGPGIDEFHESLKAVQLKDDGRLLAATLSVIKDTSPHDVFNSVYEDLEDKLVRYTDNLPFIIDQEEYVRLHSDICDSLSVASVEYTEFYKELLSHHPTHFTDRFSTGKFQVVGIYDDTAFIQLSP